MNFRLLSIVIFLSASLFFFAAAASAQVPIIVEGKTMGPIAWKVTVSSPPSSLGPEQVRKVVQEQLDRVDDMMSTYRSDSEVSLFNENNSTDWISVSADTALVVARAQKISRKSGGAFDITVGPLVSLWNFGPDKKEKFESPASETIERIRATVGFEQLQVQLDPPALKKNIAELQIDLSAIAKGYAVDRVSMALADLGLTDHFVEVGGEVRTSGHREEDGVPLKWRIGIQRPDRPSNETESIVSVSDMAVASSGDYRNFHREGGKRYSHVIDPRTGRPSESRVASASVVASDCMTADALATASMVLGFEAASALCKEFDAECLILLRSNDEFEVSWTPDFPFHEERKEENAAWWTPLITIGIFVGFILAMSVGVIFSNRRIQGSCGGLASMEGDHGESACSMCSNPSSECRELKEAAQKKVSEATAESVS